MQKTYLLSFLSISRPRISHRGHLSPLKTPLILPGCPGISSHWTDPEKASLSGSSRTGLFKQPEDIQLIHRIRKEVTHDPVRFALSDHLHAFPTGGDSLS